MPGVRLADRYVMARRPKYPPGEWARLRAQTSVERDRRILQLAADGLSNKEIARELSYSAETIKSEMKRLYRQMGARNRTHAVIIAMRHGWFA